MGDYSRELCGGTHLDNVGQVGLFKLMGEESVAAGTRRITALVGKAAFEYVHEMEQNLDDLSKLLRVPPAQFVERVTGLLDEIKSLKKQAKERRPESGALVSADDLLAAARLVSGAVVVIHAVENATPDQMRQLVDVLRRKQETGLAVLLAAAADGKVQLVAGFSKDLIDRGLHAGNWLKEVAPIVGGGGGGRPDLAQAGGKLPDQIEAALKRALDVVIERLKV
jgi:alanyl-tRNA synthetase